MHVLQACALLARELAAARYDARQAYHAYHCAPAPDTLRACQAATAARDHYRARLETLLAQLPPAEAAAYRRRYLGADDPAA
jgi:hypothetical protein